MSVTLDKSGNNDNHAESGGEKKNGMKRSFVNWIHTHTHATETFKITAKKSIFVFFCVFSARQTVITVCPSRVEIQGKYDWLRSPVTADKIEFTTM